MRHKKITFSGKTFAVGLFLGLAISLIVFFFMRFLFNPIGPHKKVTVGTSVVETVKVPEVAKKEEFAPVVKKDNTVEIKKTDIAAKTEVPSTPVKFDGEIIKVGFMGDFSGGMKDIDNPWLEGMKIRIDEANENNELKNRQIKLEALDHKGESQVAVSCVKKFADEMGIKILLTPSGSEQVFASINILEQKNCLAMFPVTMFDSFKNLNLKTFLFTFPVNEQEASVILNYGMDNLFVRKFAIFYEESRLGNAYLKDAQAVIEKKGLQKGTDYIVTSYPANTTETRSAADLINKFSPDSVLLFSSPIATAALLNQVNIASIKYFLGTSFMEGDIFYSFARARGLKVFIARSIPNLSKLQVYADYLNAIKKRNKTDSLPLLAGYVWTGLFVEVVKKIEGSVTKESILEQVKREKTYDVGGLKFYFDPLLEINLNDNFHVIDLDGNIFDLHGTMLSSQKKN